MCKNMLDLDVHRRKWTLTVNRMKCEIGETETVTRSKVKAFAKDHLKIEGADHQALAACHRLSQKTYASIMIGFVDLKDRNEWLGML